MIDENKKIINIARTHSIPKPAYEAVECVFENGWDSIRRLGLLEHFARSTQQVESWPYLERAPESARLLLLALAHYSRHRPSLTRTLPAAVLLTYIMLEVDDDKPVSNNLDKKPILFTTIDSIDVTPAESRIAAAVMKDYYLQVTDCDSELVDQKLLHSLAEFKSCLLPLTALNALCGKELPQPLLSRTYNGTLVYNLLYAANRALNHQLFLAELLSPAPTVYTFLKGLLRIYRDLL